MNRSTGEPETISETDITLLSSSGWGTNTLRLRRGADPLPSIVPVFDDQARRLAILGMVGLSHDTAKARCPNRVPGTFTPLRNGPGIPGMQTAIVSLVTDAEYSNPVSPSPAGRLLRVKIGN